jgi:putative hydrolase of the HAD superfamily
MGLSKPQPEIFQAVLMEVSLRPDQILFIDDKSSNVAAAQLVGIPSLEYTRCDTLRRQLSSAGVTMKDSGNK